VVLSTLLLPAMIVRFYQGWFQMLLIDLPIFLASSCSLSGFYLAAQRALGPRRWLRALPYLPFIMAVGIGICVRNAQAVMEAVVGKQSEFARTPKYSIEGQRGTWRAKLYRNRAGWIPYVEIGLGVYFAWTVWWAIQSENFATVPFLLLFVWGYLYVGVMSLGQAFLGRLRLRGKDPREGSTPVAPASTAPSAPAAPATGV
jgi:hypothetical protein